MSYPLDHHNPNSDSAYQYQGANAQHSFDRHHQYYGGCDDLGNFTSANYHPHAQNHHPHQQQYRVGQSPMNELDNFSSISTLRHHPTHQGNSPIPATVTTTDPYYDTKVMKQKLLSVNVPESCV